MADRAIPAPNNHPPSDEVVRAEVEEALRHSERPMRLFDLKMRCRGRIAQIEAEANRLVEMGRCKKVRYAWIHAHPIPRRRESIDIEAKSPADKQENKPVHHVDPKPVAREAITPELERAEPVQEPRCDMEARPPEPRPIRRDGVTVGHLPPRSEPKSPEPAPPPSPPAPLPRPPLREERPVVVDVSRHDAMVPKVVAVLDAHPYGLDAARVAEILDCEASVASYSLRLAWGRAKIDSRKFGMNRVFFPKGSGMLEPEWLKAHLQKRVQRRERRRASKRGREQSPPTESLSGQSSPAKRRQMSLQEAVLKVTEHLNRSSDYFNSMRVCEELDIPYYLASQALSQAWQRGLIHGQGTGKGRCYHRLERARNTTTTPPTFSSFPSPAASSELAAKVHGAVAAWAARRKPTLQAHLDNRDLDDLADALLKCVG